MSPNPSWAFLLDQNVAKRVAKALRALGYEAVRVYDLPYLRDQDDPTVFRYARAHNVILITHDTDFLKTRDYPAPHSGILVIRGFSRTHTVDDEVRVILQCLHALQGRKLTDTVFIIGPSGWVQHS